MQFVRTNLTPGMIVLLVILGIVFAAVVVPVLLIAGFFWLVCTAVTGSSPLALYLRHKAHRRSGIYGEPFEQDSAPEDDGEPSAANDDTIECEVISARTIDENGQEIR